MKRTSGKEIIMMFVMGLAILLQTLFVFYVQGRFSFILEDLTYSVNLSTGEKLSGFGDIISNVPYILKGNGGSVLALSVLQLIIFLGNNAADIINTLTLLIIAFLIARNVNPKRFEIMYMSMSLFMMITLNSNWDYSYLWEFGVVNFVMPAIPFLVFLLFILKEVNYFDNKTSALAAVASVLSAFLASFSNGAYALMVILVCVCAIIICKKLLAKPVAKWLIGSLVASAVGLGLYLAAPGNYSAGSVMAKSYFDFSIFPAVVLTLLMLAVSLRSGCFLSTGQLMLTGVLFVGVILKFILTWIPGVTSNGISICILVISLTLFCNLFNNLKKDNARNAFWGYLLSGVALLYSVLTILQNLGGVN